MRAQVTMPQLGETVTEGTVTRWFCKQGDPVSADKPLLEITTDKATMEVPATTTGVLLEILVEEGQTVPVGTPLAWVETGPATVTDATDDGGQRLSPLIRRLLGEAGLTPADVPGSGPHGRILREDVAVVVAARHAERASPGAASAAAVQPVDAPARPTRRAHTEPLNQLRKLIAERMVSSLHTAAQVTTVVEVDLTRVAVLRARANTECETMRERPPLSFLPFFARAAIEALHEFPIVNASIDTDAGTVTYHDGVRLGIAVDTDRGLLVPVIPDADELSIDELSRAIADIAERSRQKRITPDELSGGTFTLTNTGSRGALFDTPIINQPQVAILGTGAVVKRPVVVTEPTTGVEEVAIRSMAYLALTYDHRLLDGADATRFLVAVKHRLEEGALESEAGLTPD